MLDIKQIRDDPEPFRAGLARRGLPRRVDELLAADESRRRLTQEVEELRAEQNKASKAIGGAQGDEKRRLIDEVAKVSAELKELEPQLSDAETALSLLLASTPNLPHASVPDGLTDEDAVEVRRNHEEPPSFDFDPKDHVEIGTLLGMLDIERAVRASGSRFAYLLGDIVQVQFALMRNAMDVLQSKGFTPVIPPVLVREEVMFASGFFPTDEANVYRTDQDDLYLVGTSEVPLAALHMGEILDEAALPVRYAGYSTCFRREAGSYGKDLGGMFRVHQFDKVEMFSYCAPEGSEDEHEFLVSIEEEIVSKLELPYRVVNIAVGDLGAAAAKKYDIEVWLPGQQRYREVTSCSNYTDYAARRAQTRLRRTRGEVEVLHTLNVTATAIGRTLIAILENFQQPDGSVVVPEHLWQYLPERARILGPSGSAV
jgi:seryl-tRNA synthetase